MLIMSSAPNSSESEAVAPRASFLEGLFKAGERLSPESRIERRRMLAKLGLAWLMMMQVSTLALPGYLRSSSMAEDTLITLDWAIYLMNWASLVMTLPVVLYSALPIWRGALTALREGRMGMDVPVALGIVAAFFPSAYATWTQNGHVYFDSVVMFVSFLLTARYLELAARQSCEGLRLPDDIQVRRRMEAQADRIAGLFVTLQISITLVVALVWWQLDPAQVLPISVALLVMSCPCALAMAVPTAMAAGDATVARIGGLGESQLQAYYARVRRVANQNLYGSLAWHLLALPLAAMGWVAPWLAALSMLLSSLAVVINAWRLSWRSQTATLDTIKAMA